MRALLTACAALLLISGCRRQPPPRPNVIFIMTDDHGAQAMSAYGSRINRTPNLDRIADAGLRFDRAYCTNSICAPARATILTGKLSHRAGVVSNFQAFTPRDPTLPELMQQAGYQTALIGKWHLKAEPTGFDYWKVLRGQGLYYQPLFIEMGQEQRHEGYATNLITDFALDWLGGRDPEKPFFLMVHHKAPHRNWMPDTTHLGLFADEDVPEPPTLFDDYRTRSDAAREQELHIDDLYLGYDLKLIQDTAAAREGGALERYLPAQLDGMSAAERGAWNRAYARETASYLEDPPEGEDLTRWKYQRYIKDYLRTVASVDDNVGRLLDYLEDAGLRENTLIIYTSDQGFYLGEHGWFDKRFMYEESYRIPLVMQWPGVVRSGRASEALVMNADIAPTILDAVGAEIPGEMQGVSLMPLLTRWRTPGDWRTATYYHYYEYPGEHHVPRHYGIRTERYKLLHYYHEVDAWELYDLEEDPYELNNLYRDPAYRDIREELRRLLIDTQEQYADRPVLFVAYLEPEKLLNRAVGKPVSFANPPAEAFNRGADTTLTDGKVWTYHLYTAMEPRDWLGFREAPFDATVDMGEVVPVRFLALNTFQHQFQQAYLPVQVDFYTSVDGRAFELAGRVTPRPIDAQHNTRFIELPNVETEARYVRVTATSLEEIPAGRPGSGNRAWVFVDEIIVR